jgi:hypothetical protein
VFDRLATGKTNKMTAEELGLSVRTVEERRGKLIKELGVETRAALMELAANLAEPPLSQPVAVAGGTCELEVNGRVGYPARRAALGRLGVQVLCCTPLLRI